MSFGKSKSTTKAEPKPQIVVQPGSGSGVIDRSASAQQRTEAIPEQQSLLVPSQQDDEFLKKGVG